MISQIAKESTNVDEFMDKVLPKGIDSDSNMQNAYISFLTGDDNNLVNIANNAGEDFHDKFRAVAEAKYFNKAD